MNPAVARLSGVGLRYGATRALEAIDLELPAQRMVGLIGPDGVGKSSLLALVAGVRVIQQGTVETLGGDMGSRTHREAVCPRIAYMPQGLGKNLYMTLSVFENVDFFGRLFGHSAQARPDSSRSGSSSSWEVARSDRASASPSAPCRLRHPRSSPAASDRGCPSR